MNTSLYLFSKTFPYGEGEQYIENELPVLCQNFDEVIIYPTDWFGQDNHIRILPSNAKVLHFNATLKPYKKKLTDYFFILKLLLTELIHSPNRIHEFKRLKFLFGIALHQYHTALQFADYLRRQDKMKKIFLYSYWLSNSCVLLSILKAKKAITTFVSRAHSVDLYHYNWGLASTTKIPGFEYTKIKSTSHIFTVSRHGFDFLRKKFPHFKDKISCSYLGVSDKGVNAAKSNNFTIVTCSNLSGNKRLLELAKAISSINFPLEWVHFGDGEQRHEIEEIKKSLPANKKITLKGNTANAEIRAYLAKCPADVFVNLSIVEGLPVSIMEAISSGIPVIATNVYGNPEIVTPETGLIIPENFTEVQLIDSITQIYHSKELKDRLKKGARENYVLHFNDKTNYSRFCSELIHYPTKIN